MRYLLDTNVFIAAMRGHPAVRAALERTALNDVLLSPVVLGELLVGVRKSAQQQRNGKRLAEVVGHLQVVPLGAEVAERYAELRVGLERSGQLFGANDLWIAAQCLTVGAVLVTDNTAEFGRVDGLVVENWLRE